MGRFHACMRICPQECTKGAPLNEQKGALRLADALEAAKSHEVAVKPSSEGFANGAAERHTLDPCLGTKLSKMKMSKFSFAAFSSSSFLIVQAAALL